MSATEPKDDMTRRSFLTWAIAGLGGIIGAVLGGGGLAYFISPLFGKKKENWIDVGSVDVVKLGVPTLIEFVMRTRDAWMTTEKKMTAWVLTSNRKNFIAFDPRCPHLGCPYRWDAEKSQFLCPCHTAIFAVDGQVVSGPSPRALDRFRAKVVGGQLMIMPQTGGDGEA